MSAKLQNYIDSVDGEPHAVAVRTIEALEAELAAEKERTELAVAMAWREAAEVLLAADTKQEPGIYRDGWKDAFSKARQTVREHAKSPAATLARLEEMEKAEKRLHEYESVWKAGRMRGALTIRMTMMAEATATGKDWHTEFVIGTDEMNDSNLRNHIIGLKVEEKAWRLFSTIDASAGKYERIAGATGDYHATPDAADCKVTGNFTMTLKEPKK